MNEITTSSPHGFNRGDIVIYSDKSEFTIVQVSANTFKIEVTNTMPWYKRWWNHLRSFIIRRLK